MSTAVVESGRPQIGRVELLSAFRCRFEDRDLRFADAPGALIVTVALAGESLGRRAVQARLWPDLPPSLAAKRLRQLLWRIRREAGVLDADAGEVWLAPGVEVDLHEAEARARHVVEGGPLAAAPRTKGAPDAWRFLGDALLPGWTDDHVLAAQDRWDRLRLVALERLAERSLEDGAPLDAIEFAALATGVDELAETAYRTMAAAHLARGDMAGARRVYTRYARLVRRELGVEPSAAFRNLAGQGGRRAGAGMVPAPRGRGAGRTVLVR